MSSLTGVLIVLNRPPGWRRMPMPGSLESLGLTDAASNVSGMFGSGAGTVPAGALKLCARGAGAPRMATAIAVAPSRITARIVSPSLFRRLFPHPELHLESWQMYSNISPPAIHLDGVDSVIVHLPDHGRVYTAGSSIVTS